MSAGRPSGGVIVAVLGAVGVCVAYLAGIRVSPVEAASHATAPVAQQSVVARAIEGVEYPVNQNGQTYGAEADEGEVSAYEASPDLISVLLNDPDDPDAIGYMAKEDWFWKPDVENPEEAQEWMDAGCPRDPVPLYASDGQTVVGWWVTEDGVQSGRAL